MASQWDRSKMDVYFDMAEGYGVTPEDGLVRRRRPGRFLAGGAGVVSTVEDLARFDIALDTGVLGGPELMRKLFTPAVAPNGTVLPYAYGWYVQQYRGETLLALGLGRGGRLLRALPEGARARPHAHPAGELRRTVVGEPSR